MTDEQIDAAWNFSTGGSVPLKRVVRPLVPKGSLWTRHYSGYDEWWTHGDYLARQAGGNGRWVLRYRDEYIGNAAFLQDVQKMASEA